MKFYNIYIEHDPIDNFYINVINEDQLSTLVLAYLRGDTKVTIKGSIRNINNPKKFLIYSITELERLGTEQTEIERNLVKAKYILGDGKMSQKVYSNFGTNVTDVFTNSKGWGSWKDVKSEEQTHMKDRLKDGKIFISHSSKNKDIVNRFCDLVLHNGLNIDVTQDVFNTSLDGSKPRSGEDFRIRIKDELINAKLVLQFISKEYRDSQVCMNEMGAAWVLSDNVIPIIIEKDEFEVGFIHSTNQQCKLSKESSILNLIDDLKERGIVKNYNLSRLTSKVKEFVQWLDEYSKLQKKINQNEPEIESPVKTDTNFKVFRVKDRTGLYLKKANNYHLFPDDNTIKLTGYSTENSTVIELSDFDKMTKGQNLQSVHNSELLQENVSKQYWILLNNKRHGIPDLDTLKYLVNKCSCKQPVSMSLDQLEKHEQANDLTSINKFFPKVKKPGWGNP